MILYVARHGETDFNREGRYQGQLESSLTAEGMQQAQALAQALRRENIARVVSSPLGRCVKTAQAVADARGVPVETDARLLEIHHGSWQGRLRGEIERAEPQLIDTWRHSPGDVRFEGGESLADVAARFESFAATLDGNTDVVLVTHDVLVRLAILRAANRPLADFWMRRVVNGGYAQIAVEQTRWTLLEECVESHLDGLLSDPVHQAL